MGKSDKVIKLKFTKGLLHLPNTQFIDKKYYQTKTNIAKVLPLRKIKKEEVMKKKRFFSVIATLAAISMFFCINLNAQIFEKEYPELSGVIHGPSRMCKTNDNGFAFVGSSSGQNVYMVKLNSEYEIEWHKQVFARPGQTGTKNLVQDDNGYFYVGGNCYSDDNNDKICYLIKLDSLGNMVKEKIWRPENSKYSFLVNFVLVKDGLMVLNSAGFDSVENYYFVYTTFLNKELEIVSEKQREKILRGTKGFRAICSDETGFLLVGCGWNLYLKKIENDSIVWEKTIDAVQNPELYRFIAYNCQSVKDGYLIGGNTVNYEAGFVLIDKSGNLIWVKEFKNGTPVSSWGVAINSWESKYNDGYILLCRHNYYLVDAEISVIKVDYDGKIRWQQESPGHPCSAVYLKNGNIVCVGQPQQAMTCLWVFYHDIVGIDTEPANPESITLFQNYPNPFNASTIICFDLPYDSQVKLIVYDITGREVSVLVDEKRIAGCYSVIWNPRDIASGMYVYRLIANQKMICKKMVFEK